MSDKTFSGDLKDVRLPVFRRVFPQSITKDIMKHIWDGIKWNEEDEKRFHNGKRIRQDIERDWNERRKKRIKEEWKDL